MEQIVQTGTTTSSGELLLPMGELNEWLAEHKNCRIIATFAAVPRGTSKALTAYYYGYIVPAIKEGYKRTGLHLTQMDTELRIREAAPMMWDEMFKDGRYIRRLRGLSELSAVEMQQYFEYIRQWAAENLYTYIEDPRVI